MIFLLKLTSRILNLFPTAFVLFVGDVVGWFFCKVVRFRRRTVTANLKLAFSEASAKEINDLALRNYQHYGRMMMEVLRSIGWDANDFKNHVVLEGTENIDYFVRRKEGGFLLTGHLGNWEIALGALSAHGYPIDIVVKRAKIPALQRLQQWYRHRRNVGIFFESGTAKDILRSISRGRFVVFMMDQFMGPPIGLPVSFFGKRAGTTVSLALLTEKRQVPILPGYCYRDKKGKLRIIFDPPLQFPPLSPDKNERFFEKTQFYNNVLEDRVRKHPEQWLWLHRRWKEYKGSCRWVTRHVAAVSVSLLIFLAGCVSKMPTQTGISIPADPVIEVPEFSPPVAEPESRGREEVSDKKKKPIKKSPVKEKKPVFYTLPSDQIPFEVGEKLELDLSWMGLSAGRATLEVQQGTPVENRPTLRFLGNVVSSRLVDAIYHVDNTVESLMDAHALIPYKYLLHQLESAQVKETRVTFDHIKKKAYFWAKRLSKKYGDENVERMDELLPAARDVFGALYFARTLEYSLNKKQTFAVYENGQNWDIELLPVSNELVTGKLGVFQCWKMLVVVKLNNVLKPTGDLFLWLSDDSKKYVVKFEAKLGFGSLFGKLAAIRERL